MKRILTILLLMPFMALAGTIGEALNCTSLTWTTGGNANWFVQTEEKHHGQDAVRSGAIGNSQSSWMQTTITGAKQVSFWWKVSSESNYDFLKFYVDGTEKKSISGTGSNWSQETVQVTGTGTHTLKWQYSKDGSQSSGSDCGWVDQLVITDVQSGSITTYYVNGTTGSDSNTGLSATAAKKTIQAAIDVAIEGSTVFVAAGTYQPIVCVGKTLRIESLAGKSSAIIDGGHNSRCVKFTNAVGSFGPPKMDSGAYDSALVGFTLRNGVTNSSRDDDDNDGGGVKGGTIEDCIIENCSAWGAGGASCAKLIRCIVRNNVSGDDGGGCWECVVYDSLIVSNRANNSWGGAAGSAASCSKLYNCTMTKNVAVENNCSSVGALDYYISAYNCIVYGNVTDTGKAANITSAWGEYYGDNINNYTVDPGFVDAANGDYRLAADSACIDAGNNSYVTSETDFAGNARIANGKVDIGCYEYGASTPDGLVAWYKFDGNVCDSSGNGNNGVAHGGTVTADRFGNANSAYRFDGDDWISVAHTTSLSDWSKGLTISVWIKPEAWYGNQWLPLVCKANYSNREGTFRYQVEKTATGCSYQLRGNVNGSGDNSIVLSSRVCQFKIQKSRSRPSPRASFACGLHNF